MWSTPKENEDSAGFADSLIDSAFAIIAAVAVVLVLSLVRMAVAAFAS